MAQPSRPGPRKRLRVVFFSLALSILAALGLAEAFGWPFLRAPLERLLARELERPVRISAPFRLHLLGSLRVQAGELWIAAPPDFDVPHLVSAQGLAIELRYRDMWALRSVPGLGSVDTPGGGSRCVQTVPLQGTDRKST